MVHSQAPPQGSGGARYRRRRPEQTLLFQLVEQYYPVFAERLRREGRCLPAFVEHEFEDYLRCGRLEHGFLRVRCVDCKAERLVAFSCKHRGFCPSCGARRMVDTAALLVDDILPHRGVRQWVLSLPFPLRFLFARDPGAMSASLRIVIRAISAHLIASSGLRQGQARAGSVTLIQRFGGALNLNIHFHMMFLDGVYDVRRRSRPRFVPLPSPTVTEMAALVHRISERVGRHLERRGLLVRDAENAWLEFDADQATPWDDLAGHSITYRIAVGPNQGRKAFTLQTLPTWEDDGEQGDLATAAGFSLHAGVAARANERDKIERLCRYIARPALASSRLSLTREGLVRYAFKTPWRDGTTHVLFEPLDFIARLAALIPRPGVNLTRYHGVLAPNSPLRALVTPARRGKRPSGAGPQTEPEKRRAMTWARRLKRVFRIDIEKCIQCGGAVKIIACIQDPTVIRRILDHLKRTGTLAREHPPQAPRAPPLTLFPSGVSQLD